MIRLLMIDKRNAVGYGKIKKYLLGEPTADELFRLQIFQTFKDHFFTGILQRRSRFKALANSVCDNLIEQGVFM